MAMIALVEDNKKAIVELCKRFGVRRLALFGSAATGTFNPATSDLDFVVDFIDYGPGVARRFISFADALERLSGRSVDLVFGSEMKDPDFRHAVLASEELIFDVDRSRQTAA